MEIVGTVFPNEFHIVVQAGMAEGFDNDLWIGTTRGAIRKLGEEYHYFGAHHWLPGDNVRDIAVGNRVAYIATDGGLGIIRYEAYTLRKKAAYFERELEEWGKKRLFVAYVITRSRTSLQNDPGGLSLDEPKGRLGKDFPS